MADTLASKFPDLFVEYDVGNPWRRPRSVVATAIMHAVIGPHCPGGVDVDYRAVPIRFRQTKFWARVRGVAEYVSMLPRNLPHAACLAFEGLEKLEAEYGAENVLHGIARVTRSGSVIAGLMPHGVRFGSYTRADRAKPDTGQAQTSTLMYRTKPSLQTDIVAPAVFARDTLFIPIKTDVLAEHVPTHEASAWFGGEGAPVV